jgi:hypothetical protein
LRVVLVIKSVCSWCAFPALPANIRIGRRDKVKITVTYDVTNLIAATKSSIIQIPVIKKTFFLVTYKRAKLAKYLQVRPEPTQVENLSGAPLKCRILALPENSTLGQGMASQVKTLGAA